MQAHTLLGLVGLGLGGEIILCTFFVFPLLIGLFARRKGYSFLIWLFASGVFWILSHALMSMILAFLPFANKPGLAQDEQARLRKKGNTIGSVALGIATVVLLLCLVLPQWQKRSTGLPTDDGRSVTATSRPSDYEADAKLLADVRAKAEKGDAIAQSCLGFRYYSGLAVVKDEVEAVKWWRKAAEQGEAVAQYNLGIRHYTGEGVSKDAMEAVKWFRKAAEQGNADAQNNLGTCFIRGEGVPKNVVEAVKWYRKAAELGCADAQYNLGVCYSKGESVSKDGAEAVKWYRKAVEQDYAKGEVGLGDCYFHGQGVVQDYMQAVKWYRKAAEQNHAEAQNNLGVCYYNGQGVPKDGVEAYKWWLLAAGQAEESAKEHVTLLENMMTPEQIVEGQKLARNFKPRERPSTGADSSAGSIVQTRPESSGTGFFITEDGYLITNEHLAGNGAQVRLITQAGFLAAKVLKVDMANDLALLKVEGKFTALPVASSRAVNMGCTVATVGFPNVGLQGFAPKLAKGEIAALSGAQDDSRYFQISVPIQPGNSGGALVDERGNVVGVVAAKLDAAAAVATSGALPENVNYAVKSSFLLGFLESVPGVAAKLKKLNTKNRAFEEVVRETQQATTLVLVY